MWTLAAPDNKHEKNKNRSQYEEIEQAKACSGTICRRRARSGGQDRNRRNRAGEIKSICVDDDWLSPYPAPDWDALTLSGAKSWLEF
jgi:hypothetical protein